MTDYMPKAPTTTKYYYLNGVLTQLTPDGIETLVNFSQMPVNEVANFNTPEALNYFWANKDFNEYFTPQRMKHYETVAAYIQNIAYKSNIEYIAEFGSGCGQLASKLQDGHYRPFTRYAGIDYAASAVFYAQTLVPNATFIRGDILDNGLPSQSYDLALCIEVLEHITDYRKALTEMFRVLKPGGAFVLTVPNALLDLGAPYHVNFWQQADIVNLLAEYGEVVHHEMIMDNASTLVHVRKAAQ